MRVNKAFALISAVTAGLLLLFLGLTQPDTLFPALNTFLMIGLGLGSGFVLHHRYDLSWGLFGAGALTFIFSQIGHIPFNAWVLNPWLAKVAADIQPGSSSLIVWGVFLGLSAGLFEETARWLVLRFWRKDIRTWRTSLMFGAGHAGIEAILLGIFAFIAFIQLFLYRQFDPQVMTGLTEGPQLEMIQTTVSSYWASNWGHLWGSLERFSVIPVHLAATVMVFRSVQNSGSGRKVLWFLAAVVWHALVDFLAVVASRTWSIPVTEGIIFILGLFGWGIVFLLRDSHPPPIEAPQQIEAVVPLEEVSYPVHEQQLTINELEESRYD